MKTAFKTFTRMFLRHKARLVSVILMVLVSVGFCAGIAMGTDKMNAALDDVYREKNVADLIVKSTREEGFTEEELALFSERYGEENLLRSASLEFEGNAMQAETDYLGMSVSVDIAFRGTGMGVTRVYFYDMPPSDVVIGKLSILKEQHKTEDGVYEIYAERATPQLREYALGTSLGADLTFTVQTPFGEVTQEEHYDFSVCGIIEDPMHMATRKDPSLLFRDEEDEPKELESVLYIFDSRFFDEGHAPNVGDVAVRLPAHHGEVLSSAYKNYVEEEKAALEELLGVDRKAEILTLSENYSFASFHEYAAKIGGIGYVMMAVFLAVTLLVVLSTMIRLLDEERGQIACLTTLGYSPFSILAKYLLFAAIGTIVGALLGYFAGLGLSYIIYRNFDWNYSLPPYPAGMNPVFSLVIAAIIVLSTLLATLLAGRLKLRERPADLLRPRPPRSGRKVLLEKIPLLWNRFSFRYKSSLRNVFRYKIRFFMTVIAGMAATALVLAGLAVLDCCLFQDVGTAAMIGVGIVVVIFAALLDFVVIYTLTNINVSERERELATLMVLGYHDREVTGYIFREIYMTGGIGIALGLPLGCLLCYCIFEVMGFGSIPGISWFVWLLAPLLSALFTFLVTRMLAHKIKKINMNESLKAIE